MSQSGPHVNWVVRLRRASLWTANQVEPSSLNVNDFVSRHLWMDFSVWSYRGVDLEVSRNP